MAADGLWGDTTKDGARISLYDRAALQKLKRAAAAAGAAKPRVTYEYASVANCGSNRPDAPNSDDQCPGAAAFCTDNTVQEGLGPSVRLFRRQVGPGGASKGPWVQYGITCFPDEAPGAAPSVTMAMVLAAFHDTTFAKASLQIQPKGNVTLVRLPTYFEIRWPQAGFEPGEVDRVDPARMAGFQVDIRPTAKTITYVYGDGSTSGPTTSLGGPYPEGDITKSYAAAGDVAVRADVSYSGQYRVDGAGWIDIPAEVTVRGTTQTLQVKTAHARLVIH